jgi:hypothetical protein
VGDFDNLDVVLKAQRFLSGVTFYLFSQGVGTAMKVSDMFDMLIPMILKGNSKGFAEPV